MAGSKRKLSVQECDAILTAKGSVLEMEELNIHGRTVRTWKRCPATFPSFFLDSLAKYSSRTFLSSPTDGGRDRERVTFAEVLEKSLTLAAWMRTRGLGKGSRIGIGGMNCTGWIVVFVATHLIGGITVAINAWLPVPSILHCLRTVRPDLVFVDEERADLLASVRDELARDGVGEVISWDSPVFNPTATLDQIEEVRAGRGVEGLSPESDAVIFFSSGTSGPPKAVLSTQRMALTNLWSGLVAPSRAALRAGVTVPPLPRATDPQKTVLLSVPLFHVTGCLSWLMRAFFGGSKMVLMPRWNTRDAIALIEEEGVTVIGGVPAVVASILQSPDLPKYRSFETVFYGGAPPSKELAREVKGRWPKAGLVQGYGLTETNAYVCSIAGQDYVERPASTGPPVPICDTKIVHPTTRVELPQGQIGVLLVRGPQVMKLYVNDPAATAKAIDREGWLDTGDIACIDADGFIYIKDRLKDIIIRGGENITSADVENALYAHPAVSEAIAMGVPDKLLGEKVGVIVALREGAQADEMELIDSVKNKLARHAVPVIIMIQHEPLARNVNGKVVKKDMKPALVAEWEKRGRMDAGKIRSRL
ncbi:hypothetical protein DB88DRAFT_492483 [Papiliotrema laurentii]|uniref:Uncharacterized protein n=1 Tax=Papiliotrema laurentii TaxID=5418 RepID=A0AAD9CYB1_PAPLA|nr:hypothetical protein DB88DRAFT_492483 [Papiliotrema laurentii]